MKQEFTYPSSDGKTQIHAILWKPEGEIKAVLQIIHGMVEYIDRYDRFARFMASHGVLVVGNDHLGHGASVVSDDLHGYFGEPDGNALVIADLHTLYIRTHGDYPDLPYIMLGHSMGSFILRHYLTLYGEDLAGAVIMGTGWQDAGTLAAGKLLTDAVTLRYGSHHRSTLLTKMALGSNNARIENPRTPADWLTHDEDIVDAYVKNPWTTFTFTANGYKVLFGAIAAGEKPEAIRQIPRDLPLFLVSGAEDPVGGYGKGVRKAYESYVKAGMTDVHMRLYKGDRHEILNELDHDIIDRDMLKFVLYALKKKAAE